MPEQDATYKRLLDETGQSPVMRRPVYKNLERLLENLLGSGCSVVSFFTSFRYPVVIDDTDATMLEEVLRNTDLNDKKLVLLLNSPGGDALAAERIVNICRAFSPKGFDVIVPKMAKSAATMVCLGADEILMSHTSELGPIDPQILVRDENGNPIRYQAAHEILTSYEELMEQANTTEGRIEPYLQQLSRFDARDVKSIESAQNLSETIAVNLLKTGFMKKTPKSKIKGKIKAITDPTETKDHGRPVFYDEATRCGLPVKLIENTNEVWGEIWELYVRLNYLTQNAYTKIIESIEETFTAEVPD